MVLLYKEALEIFVKLRMCIRSFASEDSITFLYDEQFM